MRGGSKLTPLCTSFPRRRSCCLNIIIEAVFPAEASQWFVPTQTPDGIVEENVNLCGSSRNIHPVLLPRQISDLCEPGMGELPVNARLSVAVKYLFFIRFAAMRQIKRLYCVNEHE